MAMTSKTTAPTPAPASLTERLGGLLVSVETLNDHLRSAHYKRFGYSDLSAPQPVEPDKEVSDLGVEGVISKIEGALAVNARLASDLDIGM